MLGARRLRLVRARLGACSLVLSGAVGCHPALPPDSPEARPSRARRSTTSAPLDGPRILSAQLVHSDAPTLGGKDAIVIVFSEEVDPASLFARGFFVALADGGRVVPDEAVLAPASEGDENRTVLLMGDFGDPVDNPPTDVTVVGRVYAERGAPLLGVSGSVRPYATPNHVVAAHRVAVSPSACPGFALAVRTYWANFLRKVDPAALGRIDVVFDGGTVHPASFDDHRMDADEAREDNVLDLCLRSEDLAAAGIAGASAEPRLVRIEAGVFMDPEGIPSAPVEVEITATTHDPNDAIEVAHEDLTR